jgi:hypothetical protein
MAYFFSNLYQDDSCILLLHSKQPTKMAFHHQNANSKLARSADHLYIILLCKQTYATWAVYINKLCQHSCQPTDFLLLVVEMD